MFTKYKALWLPSASKLIIQILLSLWSYLTLPFFHENKNAILKFFQNNYYQKSDDSIFDGNNRNYYSQIERTYNLRDLENKYLIDLGSGPGALYHWLKKKRINFLRYEGVDFAVNNHMLSQNAFIIQENMINYCESKYEQKRQKTIFMSNSLCYITDEEFIRIINVFNSRDEMVIVEPSPNLFWNIHFNEIKPKYRKMQYVINILQNSGWEIKAASGDYLIKWNNKYLSKVSYLIFANKL